MESNRPAQDFETMLRVRLERHRGRLAGKGSGASEWDPMVCRGFDPERANAFLEGVLTATDTARYEEHLTSCLACRQAVIELHRLPVDVAVPSYDSAQVVSQRAPAVSGWFRSILNSVRLAPFQWASAAVATCALLVVISMFVTRPDPIGESSPSNSATSVAQVIVQSTPEAEARQYFDAPRSSQAVDAVSPKANSVPVSPSPQTTNARGLASQPVLPKAESLDLIFGRTANRQTAQMSPSISGGAAPQFNIPYNAPSITPQLIPQVGPQSGPQVAQAIPPSPQQAPSEKAETARTDSFAMQAGAQTQKSGTRDSAESRKPLSAAMDFMARSGLRKAPTPTPTPNIEDEDIRAMTRKVRDKTFRFDRGRWVDEQFKTNRFLTRIQLDRGSEQYKKILNDIPSLQAFFDLGPVIVVWEFKVYQVR